MMVVQTHKDNHTRQDQEEELQKAVDNSRFHRWSNP